MRLTSVLTLTSLLAVPTAGLHAQQQQHRHPPADERLGAVHFANSCRPEVAPRFDRAMALLHSFEFGSAMRGFEEVLAADSTCAMAWWGIALGRWTNPMAPGIRPPALLARGKEAADAAARLAVHASERERGYIAAVSQLYHDHARQDQATRLAAYEKAMGELAAKYPDDAEARIFHAISLVASASPSDKTYEKQLRAGAMLERMFASQPDHPGLAHYIIHAYDYPALASRAEAAARRYADIAPSAAHALHMPSHTFTRVGMWRESVGTNLRSRDAALTQSALAEALHAVDYAVYASLQMRRDSAALALLREAETLGERFDPSAVVGAAPGSAGLFALAAIPARYALERRAWSEAAALTPRPSAFPYTDALTWFAKALGAARLRDTVRVRVARDTLEMLRARLDAAKEGYWAEQVAIQRLSADAWLDFAAGRRDAALTKMREAANREDATEKAAVTPGPLAPARELLADMLMEAGRPRDALAEYRAALTREPNRYWTLAGGVKAAQAAGDKQLEQQYSTALRALTAP